ncbi:alpha/beta hydrolase [Aquihabitans sp. G128]|uniref:alpha/beta fold hydrolase n=1 Tax=Aquihabitans sp. G128 TaxID=2849779 RepID=UPI001C215806|nr:alpha/beta hydrolase [Aquihabitans sp. G128]QXC59916.1 alpha/beta hydrolase [Aquihabitans sp. G128]
MPAIFVHGVPETTELWGPLVERLERDDVVLLGLPGFGSPAPDFEPNMEGYASWLAGELTAYDDVDLVVHDWGALLALRVLADRPENIRSWVMDGGDLASDFEWHDLAKLWISAEGEGFMAGVVGGPEEDRAGLLAAAGVPAEGAAAMARTFDETMAACILTLYRSSVDLGNEWGPGIDSIHGPGLVLDADADPFKVPGRAQRLADRTIAEMATLPGAGHWWMLDSPDVAAEAIQRFWSSLA